MQVLRRANNDIQIEGRIDSDADACCLIELIASRHDNQNVNIAVGVRSSIREGTEQYDPIRVELINNVASKPANDPHAHVRSAIQAPRLVRNQ
jgi:hypothetical protein